MALRGSEWEWGQDDGAEEEPSPRVWRNWFCRVLASGPYGLWIPLGNNKNSRPGRSHSHAWQSERIKIK